MVLLADCLHLWSAGSIARLLQSLPTLKKLDEGIGIYGRIGGVAKAEHLPTRHSIRPLWNSQCHSNPILNVCMLCFLPRLSSL